MARCLRARLHYGKSGAKPGFMARVHWTSLYVTSQSFLPLATLSDAIQIMCVAPPKVAKASTMVTDA